MVLFVLINQLLLIFVLIISYLNSKSLNDFCIFHDLFSVTLPAWWYIEKKELPEQGQTAATFMQLTNTSKLCCRTESIVEGQEPYIVKQIIMSTNEKSCTVCF